MRTTTLAVLLYGQHIADLEQSSGGQHALHYREEPGSTPLSMPIAGRAYSHRFIEPFLEGLLPERQSARETIARDFGVSPRNRSRCSPTSGSIARAPSSSACPTR